MTRNDALLRMLAEYSYAYSETADFALASGRRSNFYIDCKATTMRHGAGLLIAEAFEPYIPVSAIAAGGLTAGADPIAFALRDFAKQPLHAFVVRKQAKGHGLGKRIEGPVAKGDKVVVVDDVITTGGSTIEAITAAEELGLEIVAVVALVDRQENAGLARVKERVGAQTAVHAVFTREQIHAAWEALRATTPMAGVKSSNARR